MITDDNAEKIVAAVEKTALNILAGRSHSKGELAEKLKRKYYKIYTSDILQEVIPEVIENISGYGYLDDEDYARKFAIYLVKTKLYGRHKVYFEMRRKHLPSGLIEDALAEFSDEDFRESAELQARKRSITDKDDMKKAINALVARGFSYGTAQSAVEVVCAEEDAEF
ncbi:hypothetical protein FACS189499_00390 [Clostridia bacterium]|nr:hypothetical protein FACS189499_00390 [Clostridia bacterium]